MRTKARKQEGLFSIHYHLFLANAKPLFMFGKQHYTHAHMSHSETIPLSQKNGILVQPGNTEEGSILWRMFTVRYHLFKKEMEWNVYMYVHLISYSIKQTFSLA